MNEGIIIFNNPEDFLKVMEQLQENYLNSTDEEGVDYNI